MPVIFLLIAMASIQSGASLAKELFIHVGPMGTTSLRLLFACLILFILWRPWKKRFLWGEMKSILFYGMSLGFMNLTFYLAIEKIPLGVAVAIEFTGPLMIAVISSKRILDYLWVLLAGMGIFLLLPLTGLAGDLDPWGILYALMAAVCWAFYILAGHQAAKTHSAGMITSIGMFVALLCVLPFGLISSGVRLFNPEFLPLALGVAVLSSVLPYTLEMYALKKIPKKEFGILMSLEPAFAALSGYFLLHENLSYIQWLAIVLIMASSVGVTLTSKSDY